MDDLTLVDVRVTHQFAASAEEMYDAWFDKARVARWFFAAPGGTVVRAEIDARVGGSFLIVDRRDAGDIPHYGTYLELERPRRIAFEFSVMSPTEPRARVNVDITAEGTGSALTLTHEQIPSVHADRARNGWSRMLGALASAVEGRR